MIVFIGDSHIRALVHGYMRLTANERQSAENSLGPIKFAMAGPAYAFENQFWKATPAGFEFIEPLNGRIVDILGQDQAIIQTNDPRRFVFSIGFQPSIIYRKQLYDKWTLGKPTARLAHVSTSAFQEAVLHYNRHVLAFFDALKSANVRFSVLSAPPTARCFSLVVEHGISAKKLLEQHHETILDAASKRGIEVELPPNVVREGGKSGAPLIDTLCDRSIAGSPHGNGWYGELFLRSLFAKHGARSFRTSAESLKDLKTKLNSEEARLAQNCQLAFSAANRRLDATEKFNELLIRHPDDRRLKYGFAYALERSNHLEKAELEYRLLTNDDSDWSPGWMALARVFFSRKKYAEAAEALEKARSLGYEYPDWPLRYGATLEKVQKLDLARATLRAALIDEEEGEGPRLKGQWTAGRESKRADGFHPCRMIEEPDAFEIAAHQPIDAAPYLIVLGRIELALGDSERAEYCFSTALELDPTKRPWNSYLADIAFRRGNWVRAQHFYKIAADSSPTVALYVKRLGACYERQKKYSDAHKLYMSAAASFPKDFEFLEAIRRVAAAAR